MVESSSKFHFDVWKCYEKINDAMYHLQAKHSLIYEAPKKGETREELACSSKQMSLDNFLKSLHCTEVRASTITEKLL